MKLQVETIDVWRPFEYGTGAEIVKEVDITKEELERAEKAYQVLMDVKFKIECQVYGSAQQVLGL